MEVAWELEALAHLDQGVEEIRAFCSELRDEVPMGEEAPAAVAQPAE